jgi:cell wall-associated NlpC family hydrolase
VAAGVAVAVNTLTTVTTASIVNTKLASTGAILLTAASSPTIQALSIGVAVAAGSGSGAKFGAAGAGSANTIDSTTSAFIKDSLAREITAGSAGIGLTATDTSKITAAAGAMALAGSFGGSGVAGSVGVSVTDNEITPRVHAYIDTAQVSTAGGLLLKSKADAEIAAYTIGGSVADAATADAGSTDAAPAAVAEAPIDLPPTDGSIGAQAVSIAMQYLGVPYVWGGSSPGGFDCSGLTSYVYAQLGIGLSHYTGSQWNEGTRVPADQLLPGDLVFFHSDLHHMGMYIGNGQMIHAPQTGDVVKISPLMDAYAGAVRPY